MMRAIVIAIAALVAGSTAAQAGFVVAPIVAAVGITGAAATVVTAVAGAALAVGVSYLASKYLAPKPPAPAGGKTPGGVELNIRIDADVPQQLVVGRAVTAGSLVYAETFGNNNNHLIEITSIADHPCEGLVAVFVEGQETALAADDGDRGQELSGYGGRLALRFYGGSQTQADGFTVQRLGGHLYRPWTSAMVGHGVSYVRTHLRYHREQVPGQLPWKYVVDGIRLYDPRKDSTVGGDGDHRWGDLVTHEFTTNLIVIAYNILRGIRVADHEGSPRHFYGLEGTPGANLPLENWFAMMNEADLDIDGEPQFHGGAEISVDTEPLAAVRELLKACDGRLVEVGGIYKVHVGPPGLPVLSFDDGVIRADDGDELRPIRPLAQRINHVTGKYTSPDDGWVPKVAPSRRDADAETADGRRVSGDLDVPWVQSGTHAQRLMQQMLRRARKERRHRLPLPPQCWGLEPGDVIEWTSARNGYVEKLFEVDAVDDFHDLSIVVALTEIDETDYDWEGDTDLIPEPDGTIVTDRPAPKVVDGFSAEGFVHLGDNGARKPAIRLTWNDPEDDDITRVNVEYRRASQPTDIATASTTEPEAGEMIILAALQGMTEYEVRARFESFNGYATDWSLWIPLTTPDAGITTAELDASMRALMQQLDVRGDAAVAHRLDTIEERIEWLAHGQNGAFAVIQQGINSVVISIGSRLGEASAQIDQVFEVVTTDLVALAVVITQIFAENEFGSASGIMRFAVMAEEAGVASQLGVFIRADTETEFAEAAMVLQAGVTELGGRSRVLFEADQIVVNTLGGTPRTVFMAEEDRVTIDGTLIVNEIASPNDLLRIDLDAPFIQLYQAD